MNARILLSTILVAVVAVSAAPVATFAATLDITGGGTGTTTAYDKGVLFYNGGLGTYSQAGNGAFVYDYNNDLLGVGTTTPWARLSVGTGSIAPAFVVSSSSATNFIVTNGGNVGVGVLDPTFGGIYGSASHLLTISGNGSASAGSSGVVALANNRATPTNGDTVGALDFISLGNGAAGLQLGSRVKSVLDGAGGTNGFGQDLVFYTKPDNGNGVSEQVRITSGDNGRGSLDLSGTNTGSSTYPGSLYGIHETTVFSPRNTPGFIFGQYLAPTVNTYSGSSIFSYVGSNVQPILGPNFTGSLTNVLGYEAGDITNNSSFVPPHFYQFIALGTNNGNGITTGSVDNRDFEAGVSTAGAGLGGSVVNYAYVANVPSGSGAGTTRNYGVYITGNGGTGGSGTTYNYALFSTSTASTYFAGNVGIGVVKPSARLTIFGPDTSASTSAMIVANSASTTEFQVFDNGNAALRGTLTAPAAQFSNQLCVGATCVTEAQLKVLLQKSGQ